MKQNTISEAEMFIREHGALHGSTVQLLVAYAASLNSDSEGQKSADRFDIGIINQIHSAFHTYCDEMLTPEQVDDLLTEYYNLSKIQILAAQSRPQLTDEEINKEALHQHPVPDNVYEINTHDIAERHGFIDGAKWARTKLTGK